MGQFRVQNEVLFVFKWFNTRWILSPYVNVRSLMGDLVIEVYRYIQRYIHTNSHSHTLRKTQTHSKSTYFLFHRLTLTFSGSYSDTLRLTPRRSIVLLIFSVIIYFILLVFFSVAWWGFIYSRFSTTTTPIRPFFLVRINHKESLRSTLILILMPNNMSFSLKS